MLFDVERTTIAGQVMLRVVGDLDLTSTARFAEVADAELDLEPLALYVDLSPTTFMDSSGARALAHLARKAAAGGVVLRVVCPHTNRAVRLVIELLELQQIVPVIEFVPASSGIGKGADGP